MFARLFCLTAHGLVTITWTLKLTIMNHERGDHAKNEGKQGLPCQSYRQSPGLPCPSLAPHGQLVIVLKDVHFGSRALVPWIAYLEITAQAALHMLDNKHRGRFPMAVVTTTYSK